MLEAIVILMCVGALLLASWEANKVVIQKKRPRPWWEAPPFPLENADRIYNWRIRFLSSKMRTMPPEIGRLHRWERIQGSGLREDELPEEPRKHGWF